MSDRAYEKYLAGMALLEHNKQQAALAEFLESHESEPHFKTCVRIAELMASLGRTAEAEKYICSGYRMNQSNSDVATKYAALLDSWGDSKTAVKIA